ncbi:MoxR family ATPase [Desulfobacterales bacterium HSG16]|nr:MoxR family ATPase [Desulfobacterales bacterium HSG16]
MPENNERPIAIYQKISDNIHRVIRGQEKAVKKLLSAFAAGGHVLLEDFPGTGKTTLAKALAKSVDANFTRVQFTPDLLPSDILGVSIYDQNKEKFSFHKGPIFTNILLADEVNRASPRTQSALLESMAESQVSTDGKLWTLENLFFVIATQNPVESSGTYPLPEAQMDRFALKFSLGYISPEQETAILSDQQETHPIENISSCVTKEEAALLQDHVKKITVSDAVKRYIIDIVRASRTAPGVELGASPRASLALMKCCQAFALFEKLDYVIPEHIQQLAVPVMAHRMVMDPHARFSGQTPKDIVEDILKQIPVPA